VFPGTLHLWSVNCLAIGSLIWVLLIWDLVIRFPLAFLSFPLLPCGDHFQDSHISVPFLPPWPHLTNLLAPLLCLVFDKGLSPLFPSQPPPVAFCVRLPFERFVFPWHFSPVWSPLLAPRGRVHDVSFPEPKGHVFIFLARPPAPRQSRAFPLSWPL